MTSYIVWAANQVLGGVGGWVGKNPAEATLITAALANPATRGITIDVLRIVAQEGLRSWVNITRGIGNSLVNRSVWASNTVNFLRTAAQRAGATIVANPVAAGITLALVGSIAQNIGPYGDEAGIRGEFGSVPPSQHLVNGRPYWEENPRANTANLWEIFKTNF